MNQSFQDLLQTLQPLEKNKLETFRIWVISAMQNHEVLPRIKPFKGVEFLRKPIKKNEFISIIRKAFPQYHA